MAQSVTIKDVAEGAGCSVATVSRVLNNSGPASPRTRARVVAVADALGFTFSELGRSLRRLRTRTVGCIVPSLVNPVFASAVQALQASMLNADYQLLLVCSDYRADLEAVAVRTLLAKRVDGLVLTLSRAAGSAELALARERGVPVCLMFNSPADGVPSAYVDNRAAAREVAAAFAASGHRRLAFLALRFGASDRSLERYEGFREGCVDHGLAPPTLVEVDEATEVIEVRLAALLDQTPDLTGIFASNDYVALAAIGLLQRRGLHVPDDLSVVGFDGIDVGRALRPTLATVVTNPRAMGRNAAETLIAMMGDEPATPPGQGALGFDFRRAESLAPPRVGRTAGTTASAPANRRLSGTSLSEKEDQP